MAAKPTSTAVAPTTTVAAAALQKPRPIDQQEKRIGDVLSYPILLADQISDAVRESDSFKFECSELLNLLESSAADMRWVLSIFDAGASAAGGGGIILTLPPIASNDPILSWVWSFIASLHSGQLPVKTEAANELSSLARDNDRNKQIIIEEGGILPLLKLLKDNSSIEAQFAAASALFNLANDKERVTSIIDQSAVPIIVQILGDSPMKVQIRLANLIAKMAEHSPLAKEDFARENAIRPLVTLLSFNLFMDDPKLKLGKHSLHSLVQINKEIDKKDSYKHYGYRKDRENEKPEVKLELKTSCAEALRMLAKDSVQNSRRITETKGLLCLAKPLVELLGHRNGDVAAEVAGSLGKFACPDNFLCAEHCKTIIDFGGVPPLIRLLRGNEKAQLNGLVLTCYLAIHAGKSEDLERAGILGAFEGVDRAFIAQYPKLRELISQAVYQLSVFHQSHSGLLVAQRHSGLLVAQRQF
ncbi:armadillo repeat only 4 [Striga hermonthica]|uniref:Armadillo repeat only 4 n=1 Tax=Striga hermonthica TaxID=68872 RepID=A0A9N7N1V4_STRHE|nr:armadillo repeat only 4 [Striga hermonthica]